MNLKELFYPLLNISYIILLFLVKPSSILSQTPKTDGLIIVSDKFNLLYANVENPISINQSFDSLSFEDGKVKYFENSIDIIPNIIGRKELSLFKDGEIITFPFRVLEIETQPYIFFSMISHGNMGRIQDKRFISIRWDIDYDDNLEIVEFKIQVDKVDGSKIFHLNKTGIFNPKVISVFRNLSNGDKLKIFDIKCRFPNGNIIMAENYEVRIKQ